MRRPQKNRAAGSQEDEESGNSYGHPINFNLTELFLHLTVGLRRGMLFTEIKANLKLRLRNDFITGSTVRSL